jgi:integration host factor subunit beta
MNRQRLIEIMEQEKNLSPEEATEVVNTVFSQIADTLVNGGRVEIRGLCSFFVKNYKSYYGRNPKTGERVKVKPKKLPFFKCGKELKERVNNNGTG